MDFGARVAGVASLNEPVRRALYRYVVAQDGPVSRDDASEGLDIPRHTAKFHLDRLVEDGLLAVDYQRLTDRRGPGAGRPAKRYRRADHEVAVSLPERRYELVAGLMASAIEASVRDGVPVAAALDAVAQEAGRTLAAASASDTAAAEPDALRTVLQGHGYEPRRRGTRIELGNCPFHQLAEDHTELVCGMNLALLGSLVEQVPGQQRLVARLDPAPGRCCVVLVPEDEVPAS